MRSVRDEIEQIFRHCEVLWMQRYRFVRRVRFDWDQYCDVHYVTISFRDERHFRHTLRTDEMRMDGLGALEEWLRNVERGIERYCRDNEPIRAMEFGRYSVRFDGDDLFLTPDLVERSRAEMEDYNRRMRQDWADALRHAFAEQKNNEEADNKAKQLFRSVAGEAAFNTLNSGKPIPVKGSKGTDYLLHKKASFCIERPSDGARLCAVVPGVPLWDHLLGIKLMVENDEPLFLKTANVSGGFAHPGRVVWEDPATAERINMTASEALARRREAEERMERQRREMMDTIFPSGALMDFFR